MKQSPPNPSAIFARNGRIWFTRYAGIDAPFPDSVGLRYIHYFLRRPWAETHVSKVILAVQGESADAINGKLLECHDEWGTEPRAKQRDTVDVDEILPAEDRRKLQNYLRSLQDEVTALEAEGCGDQSSEKQDEIGKIQLYLSKTWDDGHAVKFSNPSDRDRKSVQVAIARAKQVIGKLNPRLELHLKNIRTGYTCAYEPEESVNWAFAPARLSVAMPRTV